MKYLCLICAETVMEDMPEAEAKRHYEDYAEFTQAIRAAGQFLSANRLQPRETAATVRVRDGSVSVTDGPFAETREQIGGYYVIEARNMEAAIAVAARIPGGRIGCVEVRPIAEDPETLALGLDVA